MMAVAVVLTAIEGAAAYLFVSAAVNYGITNHLRRDTRLSAVSLGAGRQLQVKTAGERQNVECCARRLEKVAKRLRGKHPRDLHKLKLLRQAPPYSEWASQLLFGLSGRV
jgi:hypothetical protein